MNINDMERMISLADDKYISEMFSDNVKVKKSRPALKIAVCAAVTAAVVIGIFAAVNIPKSDSVPEIIFCPAITVTEQTAAPITEHQKNGEKTESITEISEDPDWQKVIEGIEYTEEEAEKYFPNKNKDEIHISLAEDPENYRSYDLPNEYVKQILPFYISDQETASGYVNFDLESDLSVGQFSVGDKKRSLNLYVDSSGRCYSHFHLENYISAERYGVTVYGFDFAENIEENIPPALIAFWVSDGVGYSILFKNYDPADALKVMDALILSGSSLDDVDLDQAESSFEIRKISLSEANNVEYFAGHVPQAVSIAHYGTLYLSNDRMVDLHRQYDKDGVLTEQDMDLVYFSEKNSHYLRIYYDTDHSGAEVDDHAVVSPEDMSLEFIEENTFENVPGIETHDFVIDYGDFIIGIYGDCGSETLWEFLQTII